MRRLFAEVPEFANTAGPVGIGRKQRPIGQFVAVGPAIGRRQRFRLGQRVARRHNLQHGFRKRGVDLIRIARTGGHAAGRKQVIAVVEAQPALLAPRTRKRVAQFVLGFLPPRLVMAHCVDAGGPDLVSQRGKHLRGVAPEQHDLRATLPKRCAEAFERIVQPDQRGTAIGMITCAFVVEHIDRDDGAGLRGGMERRLVGHAQIAPQPDDMWVSDKSSPDATYQPRHAELVSALQSFASSIHSSAHSGRAGGRMDPETSSG